MKATELRIGNYVISYGSIIIVESIGSKGINATASDDGKPYGMHSAIIEWDEYEHIPLTEEWLLKFGFVDHNGSFYKIPVGGSELFINPGNGVVWIERNDNVFNNPALVPYVHQLQNLYFALTSEELTSLNK